MKPTTRFRRLLRRPGLILAPFVFDAFQAKIAEAVGFPLLYMTGFGTAAARGYPDVGLVTQTEMVQNARYIAAAVRTPVLCDADTGYGNPINVWRTVREYEDAGVAGIHLEDQVFPKKCGFFEGKQVVPLEEHVQKIRAALDARRDKDFVIIARTDALAVHGWEETIRRCRAYRAAGADLVFVDGIRTQEDLETYARALPDIPKLYNGMLRPVKEVERMGFKIMIAGATIGVIYRALKDAFTHLKRKGTVDTPWMDIIRTEVADVLGLPQIYEMERRYGVSDMTLPSRR
ncbi:MAG: isocitrate lyase/PEP mutase family protein [Dehalococcoidia bacterium]|nr:isocitrate lyase/PEP mutase family protein [Dehalococcoidia bacterium]MDW8120537.1 isocitrate lyase/PEP mutase family protein [Chloroflexota bacterium]